MHFLTSEAKEKEVNRQEALWQLETCEICGKDFQTEHDNEKVVYICNGCDCQNKDANGNACYNCEGGFGNCEKDEK